MGALENSSRARFWYFCAALATITGVQVMATMSVLALATVAPYAAAGLGVGAEVIGFQLSLIFVTAIFSSLLAGAFVSRLGPARASQVALALTALGCAMLASGALVIIALASLALGMAYGLTNPAASAVLQQLAPQRHRNLVFALKQAGVPLGGALAGITLPPLTVAYGWQSAIASVAILSLAVLVVVGAFRNAWDANRTTAMRLIGDSATGLLLTLRDRRLRRLASINFVLGAVQFCLATFAVTMLTDDLGIGLVAAGWMVAMMHAAAAIARIGWSVLADRLGKPLAVLTVIICLNATAAASTSLLSPETPEWLVQFTLIAFGVTAMGWNGLMMAEIVRGAAPRRAAQITGAVSSAFFLGIVTAPSAFTMLYWMIGSFTATFGLLAILLLVPLVMAVRVQTAQQRRRKQ